MQTLRVQPASVCSSSGATARASTKQRHVFKPCTTALSRKHSSRRLTCFSSKDSNSSSEDQREQSKSGLHELLDTSDDVEDSNFRDMANRELGPLLQSMGIDAEPTAFLDEVMNLAAALQLVTLGLTFWGLQLYGGWTTAEAARAAIGLSVGLLTRPTVETELLFLPLYNDLMQLISPTTIMDVGPANKEQVTSVLNTVGALLFVGFLVPQMVFHWTAGESAQLVVPMAAGWLVFDLAYMIAFLVKLRVI